MGNFGLRTNTRIKTTQTGEDVSESETIGNDYAHHVYDSNRLHGGRQGSRSSAYTRTDGQSG
jgi:hypothetical protein